MQVWQATSGKQLFIYNDTPHPVWAVAWSPDGKRIGVGAATPQPYGRIDNAQATGPLQILDASSGYMLHAYEGHFVYTVAWSPDSTKIASGAEDKTVHVWDARTGETYYIYTHHTNMVDGLAWSPDGNYIASASFDNTVHIWDAFSNAHPFIYQGHSDTVFSVAWSPDGKLLASGSQDKTVQVWLAP